MGAWPIRPGLIPISVASNNKEYFFSPLDGMLLHHSIKLAGKLRVKFFAQLNIAQMTTATALTITLLFPPQTNESVT